MASEEDWAYMDSLRPPVYVCLRRKIISSDDGYEPLELDGRVDKEEWAHVPWSDAFVDIEGPERKPKEHPFTRFKMMYDDDTLYVAAEMMEPNIWGTITEKNSTMYHENDFEVFFNPDGSRHHYYELEVNCLNTIWELLLHRPYKDGYSIENPFNLVTLRSAVFVDGRTNSPETECVRWCVEMSWSLAELQQFDRLRFRGDAEESLSSGSRPGSASTATPRPPSARGQTPRPAMTTSRTVAGDVWRVNFSRVQYELETVVNADTQQLQYAKVPEQREDNIVWAPTGVVDIHRPERWGYVFFSSEDEQPGGELELAGAMTGFLEERMTIERVLDAVYYRQRSFHALHGGFASTMEMLYAGTPPASSPVSPPGLAKSEIKVWTEAFPLCEQLRRYELDFPVLSSRSDLVVNHLVVKHPVDDLSRLAALQIAAEAGAHSTLDNGGHRRATRRYAPALDEYDEDSDSEPGAESVNEAARPPLSPRSQEMKDREARGLFLNFMVTVRSKTQEWHMTHDGRLWQTLLLEKERGSSKAEKIDLDSGAGLMAGGSQALHDLVANRLERSLGKQLPQVEVRFENVSISARVVVKDATQATSELPTLPNVVKTGVLQMFSAKHVVEKQILHSMSGVFKPGTMTLVLGQPGSGKSSLMKLLSGRFPASKGVQVEGNVTYNGSEQEQVRKFLPQFVTYVPQHDKHLPTFSVKETLEFAHACGGGELSKRDAQQLVLGTDEDNEAALLTARALHRHYPDVILRQLGLENCQDTVVGDAMLRGVSGGERKRVTTGEMAFGKNYVMMMDEISTGLDSAATLDIISTLRSLAKKFHKTVVISLLQPSPEVFALFDEVLLLNDGYVMYHGPRDQALAYFENLGFTCPPRRDVADFMMDLGTNKQQPYATGSVPTTPAQFGKAFEQSRVYQRSLEALREPVASTFVRDNQLHVTLLPEFQQSFWDGAWTLLKRELKAAMRDTTSVKSRSIQAIVLGLLHGSTFYQFDDVNSQVVMGIGFVSINFVATNHMALIPAVMATRDVFYKQRGANFFRASSFVIARLVSYVPIGLMESLVFGSFMYWMCGFVPTASGFLLFELVLFFVSMVVAALFFFVACVSPNLNVAFPVTQLLLLFFVTFSGYVVTKDTIPDYMIWVYWLSPQGWGVRALAVNQYSDPRFLTCVYDGIDYCDRYGMQAGDYLLSVYGVPTGKHWLWYGLVFLAALYGFLMLMSCLVLEHLRYENPRNTMLSGDSTASNEALTDDGYGLLKTPKRASSSDRGRLDMSIVVPVSTQKHSFVPVTLAFRDLWYSVPSPANPKEDIDLLKGVSGFAVPGSITALMGSSGAGKTTLMDVIAGRKTGGRIRGEILLNGHPATELAIRRSTGYCEQMDIHSDASTFREALTFSAFLRQGADVPDSQKYDSVNECLELLDLNPIADQIIRGSSMEQMKRLTIGVELAAQPSVLFLDEPTSGLDARSAKLIMDGVRNVADTGRTIVCTIHQPSAVVFKVFDSMLLLKRGGEMVFFGELGSKASELVNYFEAIDGVAKLELGYNPATWMLEVIGAGVDNSKADATDFVASFKESDKYVQLQTNLDQEGFTRPSPSLPALTFDRKRAASSVTQATFLIKRFFDLYWRTASYNLTRFIISVILGLLFGITYVGAEYSSYQGINSGMGMIYMAASYITFITFNGVLPITYQERVVFYRERAAQTYNAFWYFVGSTLVEIPYCFLATLIFLVIFYPMVGFTGVGNFFTFWFCLSLLVLMQGYFGQLLVYALPNLDVAPVFASLINTIFILFTGMNPPAAQLPRGYVWLYRLTPNKYTFASLTAIVFAACDGDGNGPGCQQMTGTPPTLADGTTVEEYMDSLFWIKHSEIWSNCAYVVAWIVLIRVLALLSLRYVNHQKR
uniref:ABC transporter domain-containing protein n=1 Tax=Phytophthora ramorum TaxID=164328 RepID=H3H1R1_PHYRM